MAELRLRNIEKRYPNGFVAVKNLNLEIHDKEFITFVGPLGCGKSTILQMIAGLEEITRGELFIENRLCNELSPKDREIAMVFQNHALYPDMSVYDNMAFGLKLRKISKQEIDRRVKETAKILEIDKYLDCNPNELSDEQRQKVTIGRAIVRRPKIVLMDDPLSNLDKKLREKMRIEISKLHERLQTTFIYVTDNKQEAMELATRMIIMKDGVIEQVDSPQNLYNKPRNMFVAGFIGESRMDFVEGKVIEEEKEIILTFGKQNLKLPQEKAKKLTNGGYIGKNVIIGIRPEYITSSLEDDIESDTAKLYLFDIETQQTIIS